VRNRSPRIFGLDLMRAIAITLVVVSHSMWVFPEFDNALVGAIRSLGYIGVEIFFVLSGFLIGKLLYRRYIAPDFGWSSFKHFLIRRWFRTLPNYYFILLINIPIWLYFGRDLPADIFSYFFFLQNLTSRMTLFFTESWSLPVEEFAYLLLPVSLFVFYLMVGKADRKRSFFVTTIFLLILFVILKLVYHFLVYDPDTHVWNIDLKAVVIYRIDAIVYGVLAAYLSINFKSVWKRRQSTFFFAGLMLFGLIHLVVPLAPIGESLRSFYLNVLYLPLVSVAIGGSLPLLSQLRTGQGWFVRPITFVSLISYSVYLLHYSIILQWARFLVPIEGLTVAERLLFIAVYFAITLILSALLYRFYERPMMDLRETKMVKKLFGLH